MAKEKISNKLISINTIKKIADYFENEKEHYDKLNNYDKLFNKDLKYDSQHHIYNVYQNEVSYEFKFKSGESIEKSNYDWFIENLNTMNILSLESIWMHLRIEISSKKSHESNYNYKSIYLCINISEKDIWIDFKGNEMEDEVHKYHTDIINILNSCPPRYDKTIKNRFIRIQSLNLCLGFIFSYISIICLYFFNSNIPLNIQELIFSKNIIIILIFWAISAIFGNVFGHFINEKLYKNITPKQKYSHYSSSQKQSIYVDDVENYLTYVESQIGIFHDSIERRNKINKIFKKTLPIVIFHLIVSVIICII